MSYVGLVSITILSHKTHLRKRETGLAALSIGAQTQTRCAAPEGGGGRSGRCCARSDNVSSKCEGTDLVSSKTVKTPPHSHAVVDFEVDNINK